MKNSDLKWKFEKVKIKKNNLKTTWNKKETTNFWAKRNTNWLNKNKQNINKNWRPKKWIAQVNWDLKKEWYEPARKQDIEQTYLFLINLPLAKLKEISQDDEQPILSKIVSKNILSWRGFDIIEKMLDRSVGKPKQEVDNNISWEIKNITIELPQE